MYHKKNGLVNLLLPSDYQSHVYQLGDYLQLH